MLLVLFSRLLFKAYRIESKRYAQQLPNSGLPEKSQAAELDEVYSFIGNIKHALHPGHCRQNYTLYLELESSC